MNMVKKLYYTCIHPENKKIIITLSLDLQYAFSFLKEY